MSPRQLACLTDAERRNSYLKIGACRHGERCSRKHIKPQFSTTLVVYNMYQNPMHNPALTSNPHLRPPGAPPLDVQNLESKMTEEETREYFEKFCKQLILGASVLSKGLVY